jgi:hypothetical protein
MRENQTTKPPFYQISVEQIPFVCIVMTYRYTLQLFSIFSITISTVDNQPQVIHAADYSMLMAPLFSAIKNIFT